MTVLSPVDGESTSIKQASYEMRVQHLLLERKEGEGQIFNIPNYYYILFIYIVLIEVCARL